MLGSHAELRAQQEKADGLSAELAVAMHTAAAAVYQFIPRPLASLCVEHGSSGCPDGCDAGEIPANLLRFKAMNSMGGSLAGAFHYFRRRAEYVWQHLDQVNHKP